MTERVPPSYEVSLKQLDDAKTMDEINQAIRNAVDALLSDLFDEEDDDGEG